ncbi:MAG TPA: glycosyltransferase family 4 protein [Myxococcaceae bacterium]|nr:glycosyltransferase family 4 protein [Myxococcaceae bacterium]
MVHLHLHRRRTGVTRHVEDVVRALADRGARAAGFGLAPEVPRASAGEVWRAARTGGLVVHAHRNLELLAALGLRALGRAVRVVWTRHGPGPPGLWTRLLARGADARVTLTDEGAAMLGLSSVVVPHGVDLRSFHPPEDRRAAWAALGVPGERGVALVGRIRPAKGQGEAVAALSSVLPRAPGWHAVLVGQARGRDRAWLDSLLAGAHDSVTAVGEQRDVARWYRGATVVVQASRAESFSLAVAEAMASGCCVVTARLPHLAALLEEGRTAYTYPAGDAAALAGVLGPLLADPERAERTGRAAAEAAQRLFPLEREVAALQAIYEGRR